MIIISPFSYWAVRVYQTRFEPQNTETFGAPRGVTAIEFTSLTDGQPSSRTIPSAENLILFNPSFDLGNHGLPDA
jgi:hypothetical protein